jgi:putative transposase
MTIVCWNGEVVELIFALDCHDREAIAVVAEARPIDGRDVRRLMRKSVHARFGDQAPSESIQWLSDNEGIYTSLESVIQAERLNLKPITTPVASPESNGMSEAFVNTLRRDYIDGADRSSAARILEQVPEWIGDYNTEAPHSSLGMQSPAEYRATLDTVLTERCLTK